MRVLMTGGGTGGHVYPAVAIANTIKQNISGSEVAFVGTPRGIENKICKNEGYPIYHVEVMGISRSLSPRNIKAMYLALTSPYKAKKIIDDFKPDVVFVAYGTNEWAHGYDIEQNATEYFEKLTGQRMMNNYFVFGGVRRDVFDLCDVENIIKHLKSPFR